MGKGSAPSAPDPYASANAQYQYGTKAAAYNAGLNNVNTQGPLSSTNYNITGYGPSGAPQYTQTTTLSQPEQQILNQSQQAQMGVGSVAPQATSQLQQLVGQGAPNMPNLQYGPGSYAPTQTSINQGAFDTAMAGQKAALDPVFNQQQEQLDASLRNSGAHPGDPAYDNAMASFNSQRANAYTQAAGQAESVANQNLMVSNQGAAQSYNEAMGNAQFNNDTRSQALQQYASAIGIPMSELQSITGIQMPGAGGGSSPSQSGSVQAPNFMQAAQNQYEGQLGQYNANVNSQNQTIGDIASLAALYFMA